MWMILMLLFWVLPMGYGWGYRGWGPPYPRYIQRRREAHAAASDGSPTFNHQAWGWGGDFVWLVVLVGAFWVAASLFWRH